MNNSSFLHYIITISRPRFWLYLFGPFLLGVVWSGVAIISWFHLIWFALYFLYPANILIYGVNDMADEDTDVHNPKKEGKETRFKRDYTSRLITLFIAIILLGFLPWVLPGSDQLSMESFVVLLLFFLTSLGYSLPPLRAKTIPFLDGMTNILYALPGILSFVLLTGDLPPWTIIIATWTWCMAMHAYSAIPDIGSDKKAGIATTATVLGVNGTLWYCGLLWLTTSLLVFSFHAIVGIVLLIYPLVLLQMIFCDCERRDKAIEHLYWKFPVINGVVGMLIFWFSFL